jgi:hypothetical protein
VTVAIGNAAKIATCNAANVNALKLLTARLNLFVG